MIHLTEEEEVAAYYQELPPDRSIHFQHCAECQRRVSHLAEVLKPMQDHFVPQRGDSYGAEVWTRLLPKLPRRQFHPWWQRPWTVAPVLMSLLAVAFLGGMLTQHQRQTGFSPDARERVLLIALSDHLERSEIVLAQLLNSGPGDVDLTGERERARDLLSENRLLRETAAHDGDLTHASLLDDLERVLLDVANSPAEMSSEDLLALQQRMEHDSLLFKVRITSIDARHKGQKL